MARSPDGSWKFVIEISQNGGNHSIVHTFPSGAFVLSNPSGSSYGLYDVVAGGESIFVLFPLTNTLEYSVDIGKGYTLLKLDHATTQSLYRYFRMITIDRSVSGIINSLQDANFSSAAINGNLDENPGGLARNLEDPINDGVVGGRRSRHRRWQSRKKNDKRGRQNRR